MTPQELKNSILLLAMQGKLVEQRPEEGTGEELYQLVQMEKQKQVKAGNCKKEKPLLEITEDDKPFDIPESWKWVRLGFVANINGGYAFKSTNFTADGVRVVRISDFNENGLVNNKIVRHAYDQSLAPFLLEEKNILLCMTGGTVGKSLFVQRLEETTLVNQRVATIKTQEILQEYAYTVILSPITQTVIRHSKNSTNDNISMDTIKNFMFPLPPLAEQKRIVAKIEELLPYIERYEISWNKLEDFNKRFPADMQKSILQTAIQGNLVEQRPEEGTGEDLYHEIQAEKQRLIKAGTIKKERPLPEITEAEKPFDIPESWKWVFVGDTCTNIQYGTSKKSSQTGKVAVLRMGNIQNGKINYDSLVYSSYESDIEKYSLNCNDLLFNRTNSKELVGKTAIYKSDIPAIYAGYLIRITPMLLDSDYLNYVMQSQFYWTYCQIVRSDAIGQSNINAEKLKRFFFPLPPLDEQKRIVVKLEEILHLCEKLK